MNAEQPISATIAEYWTILARRKLLITAAIVTGLIVGGILCLVLPKSYRSSTLILIENPKIPEDIVKGIVGGSVEERLTMIQQQVMSRTLLSQIIGEFTLYEDIVRGDGAETAIETMRKDIKVTMVESRGRSSIEAFNISFAHNNPITAMKVTAKIASQFIEENLKVREQMVTGVSAFLEQELDSAKAALEAQEQAIGKFKTKHIGLLPEQLEANLRALDRLQFDLNSTDALLHKQTDKLGMVEKAINEYETSGTAASIPGSASTRGNMDPLVARLMELERNLATLLAEYKETYPDISQTRQEIAALKRQISDKHKDSSDEKDGDLARTYDPFLSDLVKHRNELRAEVSSEKERRKRLAEQIRQLEARVEQTPAREQELMILIRDYKNMQSNYQALLDKRLNAHVAENLEKRQKGEQFRILDPANLPTKPEKPNRLLIMLAGLLGGCGLGVGSAIGLEQLNPTFKRREEIEMLPGIRVLAAIPNFRSMYHQLNYQPKPHLDGPEIAARLPVARSGWRAPTWLAEESDSESFPPQLNLVAKWQPLSIAAEQYRMAATRLVLSTEGRDSTVVEITSALKGEGKTTTVVNLGYTLARDLGRRTLLVDCDLRCPALHNYVNIPARSGLVEFLDGQASLEDCLSVIDEIPCSIMLPGKSGKELNELARIQQLKAVLPQLRSKFDYIVINTPPVLPSATMGILASLADMLIIVVKAGATPQHLVQQAFTMLGLTTEAHVILNAVEAQSMPAYIYGYPMPYGGERSIGSAAR